MAKDKNKVRMATVVILMVIIAITIGAYFIVANNRKKNELKLSETNNALNEIATETGLVNESDGSFYITLYVTAGVIIIAGVVVFIYVHKKADE
jgi:hypothetical protein